MLRFLKPLVPGGIYEFGAHIRDKAAFSRLSRIECDCSTLASLHGLDLPGILENAEIEREWSSAGKDLQELGITDKAGGVNPGDRRAIYYLIRHLRPRSVLEIGTHIGASTAHMARALQRCHGADFHLATVDLVDVNSPISQPWLALGSTHSPAEMMRRLGCVDSVQFYAEGSTGYLCRSTRKYDLIFLDGNHDATQVYQEVPAALRLLNQGGHILLHDYFPNLEPLWRGHAVIHGPYVAIQRLQHEGAPLMVMPLGELPWPTKRNSRITSLAILGRK